MTKYSIKRSNVFKRQFKKVLKQGKDVKKIEYVIDVLSNGDKLEEKFHDHLLKDTNIYKQCRECHIEPDLLLIYKYQNNELILFLIEIGSHSDLFNL